MRKVGNGRVGSRVKQSPSRRNAPTKSNSRHFSSGIEKPSGDSSTSVNG